MSHKVLLKQPAAKCTKLVNWSSSSCQGLLSAEKVVLIQLNGDSTHTQRCFCSLLYFHWAGDNFFFGVCLLLSFVGQLEPGFLIGV